MLKLIAVLFLAVISNGVSAQTFDRSQLLQQWRMTCSAQNLRASPWMRAQCQQWRAQIDAMKDQEGASDSEDDTPSAPSVPMYLPPTGTDPSGPFCATAQREVVQAQLACNSGNTGMCTRVDQIKNAMRTKSCAIPVLAGERGNASDGRLRQDQGSSGGSGQRGDAGPLVNHCLVVRARETSRAFFNVCDFSVNYTYCVDNPEASSACRGSITGVSSNSVRGGDWMPGVGKSGQVHFAACRGGSGGYAMLKDGSASCH